MTGGKVHNIWNPATGIADLGADDPQALAASEIPGIKADWSDQRKRQKGTSQLADFTERLRAWNEITEQQKNPRWLKNARKESRYRFIVDLDGYILMT